jgi:hypothetical protein
LINKPGVTPQTKNIFPVLEKRSYTCTVTSLGNATIQPLTYFYLRNVPLFHGTYWITNVTHKIVPNNMVTTFKGVRQPIVSKNDVRKELLALMRQQKANILSAQRNLKSQTNSDLKKFLSGADGKAFEVNNYVDNVLPYQQAKLISALMTPNPSNIVSDMTPQ